MFHCAHTHIKLFFPYIYIIVCSATNSKPKCPSYILNTVYENKRFKTNESTYGLNSFTAESIGRRSASYAYDLTFI